MRSDISGGNELVSSSGATSAKDSDATISVARHLVKENYIVKVVENVCLKVIVVVLAQQTMVVVNITNLGMVLVHGFSEVVAIGREDDIAEGLDAMFYNLLFDGTKLIEMCEHFYRTEIPISISIGNGNTALDVGIRKGAGRIRFIAHHFEMGVVKHLPVPGLWG